MYRKSATLFTSLVLALTVTFAHAQEKKEIVDNPQYTNWAQYKVGAFAELETVQIVGEQEIKSTIIYSLKELTKDKAVISMKNTMVVGGQKIDTPAQAITYQAKVPKMDTPVKVESKAETKEGTETLVIGKEKVACKWFKTTMKMGDNTTVSTVWTSDAVPGMTVKMTSETKGKTLSTKSTTTLKKYKGDKKE